MSSGEVPPCEMGPMERAADSIRRAALDLGFARVGFADSGPYDEARGALEAWLEEGFHGEMQYLEGRDGRARPSLLLDEVRSVIVVALSYPRRADHVPLRSSRDTSRDLTGTVAQYAVGRDYHQVFREKLALLSVRVSDILGRGVVARPCVDTAPILEREMARRAGIAFTGKSTMSIAEGVGTHFLLGALLVDVDLPHGEPVHQGCGACTACLDACPTDAFVGDYVLDARRCISYLTIELRGPIPRDLRRPIGRRVFGCDVCQNVCPYNASPTPRSHAAELGPTEPMPDVDLVSLLELTASGYRRLVKGRALSRVSRPRLARNAAVALGNSKDARAVPPLSRALHSDRSPLVRSHAAWALGELGGPDARAALSTARDHERDPTVLEEIDEALAAIDPVP